MKRYTTIYYFLFMAVIMGAFASMAQNSYGMKLIGSACLGFAVAFLHEFVFSVSTYTLTSGRKAWLRIELIALSSIALLFFFRSFLIEIPFGKEGILVSLASLAVVTVVHGVVFGKETWKNNSVFSLGLLFYYVALLSFIVTFIAGIARPDLASTMGPAGFVFLLGFVLISLAFRDTLYQGEKTSLLKFVGGLPNKSGILMIGLVLMFLYFGLYQANIFPPMYSGEMPSGYIELIRRAESGEEKGPGKKRYEEFEEQYSKFVKRHRK